MIKVMVVEDHELVRTAIINLLNNADGIRVVAEAGTGEEARRLLRRCKLDVMLLDLRLPGVGGLETMRRVHREWPKLRVIGLSQYIDGPLPARFLDAGGAGYLSKAASKEETIWAIRKIHAGQGHISPEVATHIAIDDKWKILRQLSDRELQVLELLGEGHGVAAIAAILHLTTKTVNGHRRKLLKKLNAGNDVQLARLAEQYGVKPSAQ